MSMCVYSFPMEQDNSVFEAVNIFETYARDVEVMPITGEIQLRKAIHIDKEELKDNPYKDAIIDDELFLKLEERLGFLNHLRRDDSGTGKSNMNYISEYDIDGDSVALKNYHNILMDEKKHMENEYYSNTESSDDGCDIYRESHSNRFLDEIRELK